VVAQCFKEQAIGGIRLSGIARRFRGDKQLGGSLAPQLHESLVPLPRRFRRARLWRGRIGRGGQEEILTSRMSGYQPSTSDLRLLVQAKLIALGGQGYQASGELTYVGGQ